MLLLIDEKKIQDELARTTPTYAVVASNLEIPIAGYPPPVVSVSSAVMTLSPDMEKARQRVMERRQRLIESGSKPLSAEELERVIDETRGR